MSGDELTTDDILSNAEYNLQQARFGLTDLQKEILPRRIAAIRNIATYGRATTQTLQHLSSREPEFEDWYQPYREEMKDDPLMRYFWELRNEVLKEGRQDIGWKMYIKELQYPEDIDMNQKPDGAAGFFIGDQLGGIGWEVELPGGLTEKHYIGLPEDIVEQTTILSEPPQEHLGENINGASSPEICRHYIDYLSEMLSDAKDMFGEEG